MFSDFIRMMASHHYEHPEPIMMPYNMEYALPSSYHAAASGAPEMGANDLYSLHMAAAGAHEGGGVGGGGESLAAESSALNHVINLNSGSSQQQSVGVASLPLVPKERQDRDMWAGLRKRPLIYKYLAAAAAARTPVAAPLYKK